MRNESVPKQIVDALLNLNGDLVIDLIARALDQKVDLVAVLNDGLTAGLRKLGEGFENGKFYLPELMWGAQVVQQCMKKLQPHIKFL